MYKMKFWWKKKALPILSIPFLSVPIPCCPEQSSPVRSHPLPSYEIYWLTDVDMVASRMADGDALMIYRSLDTSDLLARKAKLLAQMNSPFSSETIGQKSFTRDLRFWRDQLAAIVFVLNERTNNGYVGTIVTDFSQTGPKGYPPGTVENF